MERCQMVVIEWEVYREILEMIQPLHKQSLGKDHGNRW